MHHRLLTKTRFKIACECPTKLFYLDKSLYVNARKEDSFLEALAEGGFQVQELAKLYFPAGKEIQTLDFKEAVSQTQGYLSSDSIVLFESAFLVDQLLIRIDILEKKQNSFILHEVKAKSYDKNKTKLTTKHGLPTSEWSEYLYDIAFQKYVLQKAYPMSTVQANLLLVDSHAVCPTDGLNQKFKIHIKNASRKFAVAENITDQDLDPPLLISVPVDDICNTLYETTGLPIPNSNFVKLTFTEKVEHFSKLLQLDQKEPPIPTKACGSCEFVLPADQTENLFMVSGADICWREILQNPKFDTSKEKVFSIWNYRKKDELLEQEKYFIDDVEEDDILPKHDNKPGLSISQRQWLQVQKTQDNDNTPWIDFENLKAEAEAWVYPLHFIDFETTMVAIPFHKGRHPYEGIAFQYSHHKMYSDGRIEHAGQFISSQPGAWPNYEFVRHLKDELNTDQGTIFRYSNHENTFLNIILGQLLEANPPLPDQENLCKFIRSITQSTHQQKEKWIGKRNMVDLCELVKRYHYDPLTKGSCSIKKVLPAILARSSYLQNTYSKPIYGCKNGITSHNFRNWIWCKYKHEKMINPYDLLPDLYQDIPKDSEILFSSDNRLQEGGAALIAYARMQFTEMSDTERKELRKALLKYCELDTLAMVFIVEYWLHDVLHIL